MVMNILENSFYCFIPVERALKIVYQKYFNELGWQVIFLEKNQLSTFHQGHPKAKLLIFPDDGCRSFLKANNLDPNKTGVVGIMCSHRRFCQSCVSCNSGGNDLDKVISLFSEGH